jgi:hypothetical protein
MALQLGMGVLPVGRTGPCTDYPAHIGADGTRVARPQIFPANPGDREKRSRG